MPAPNCLATIEPMEAKLVDALPAGPGWQFEPKWDGFRAVLSRSGDEVEIILPVDGVLSFDAHQARLHPAASRIAKLAKQTPTQDMLFGCLVLDGMPLLDRPMSERREAVRQFHRRYGNAALLISPHSLSLAAARAWLAATGGALDGVIAKPLGEPYKPCERAMLKVKQHRTADCVVGGFRRIKAGAEVASLLLGLYDREGLLDHVGSTSAFAGQDRQARRARLEQLIAPPGFTGKAPGRPSRWNDGKESE